MSTRQAEGALTQLATKDDLRTAIAELKADLLKWMLPFLAAQLVAILALVARDYLP